MADHDSAAALASEYARLLSLASHELRTPLSVVGGYLRMLQRDTDQPLSDRQRRMVEEASQAFQKMTELVSEMSDIVRLDASRSASPRESFDLFDVVQRVVAEANDAAGRRVRLDRRGDRGSAPIEGDRIRLHTALAALCRAVVREQDDSTVVVADCRLMRHGARRTVRIVVAKEQEFDRASSEEPGAFNETRGGTGLALPIARRIIERHGGRVWSAVDRGSGAASGAVIVSLPLAD